MFSIRIRKRRYSLNAAYDKYFKGVLKAVLANLMFLKFIPIKKQPLIILVGHRFNGNLKALSDFLVHRQTEFGVAFFTDDPSYYKKIKKGIVDIPVYSLQKLNHLRIAATASVVCTSHGASFLSFWKNSNKRPLFVELWHGAGFKNRTTESTKSQLFYDGIFVSSPTFEEFHKGWGYKESQLFVTGYGQVDSLVKPITREEREATELKYGLEPGDSRKVILFAPTWNSNNNEDLSIFNQSPMELLKDLGIFARSKNARLLVLPHLNSKVKLPQNSSIKIISGSGELDVKPLLHLVDILITDWSSIYTDFLALRKPKPVIFLDTEPTFYGFTLTPEDRAGMLTGSLEELKETLSNALSNPSTYVNRYSSQVRSTTERVWGDTLDGKSSQRYYETIKKLLHEKKR